MNIIAAIVSGAVKAWHDIQKEIEDDAAKIKSALPASALPGFDAVVSDLKQSASDALSLADSAIQNAAPAVAHGIENLLDNAMATATNGLALPLVPVVNKGVDDVVALAVAAAHAWALKHKASLAGQSQPAAN